ncbi:hypothetical protein AA310_01295 [Arthrobacter sp. YC-RL1]|uniref:hypothetical protein n=1 Tax=Arthrobacter sp. YC-RL1 TaxID=1652545 RepID=UPI00063DD16F|nr:hypothetical protein [Arthrobacter sp. YC-RL1]KLI90452.1 hypothetical protein AA310_01295 [Arthrobacter sp. YC-RL1]
MSSLKDKMKPNAKAANDKTSSVSESFRNPDAAEQDMKPLNVRIPKDLHTQIKLYAAANDVKQQVIVAQALREFLEKNA